MRLRVSTEAKLSAAIVMCLVVAILVIIPALGSILNTIVNPLSTQSYQVIKVDLAGSPMAGSVDGNITGVLLFTGSAAGLAANNPVLAVVNLNVPARPASVEISKIEVQILGAFSWGSTLKEIMSRPPSPEVLDLESTKSGTFWLGSDFAVYPNSGNFSARIIITGTDGSTDINTIPVHVESSQATYSFANSQLLIVLELLIVIFIIYELRTGERKSQQPYRPRKRRDESAEEW